MISSAELFLKIIKRDSSINDIDPYLPKTLASLMGNNTGRVQFPDGSVLSYVKTLESQKSEHDVSRETIIAKYAEPGGDETFFKLPLYFNSWDDGEPDDWEWDGNIVEVKKIPVQEYRWEEV